MQFPQLTVSRTRWQKWKFHRSTLKLWRGSTPSLSWTAWLTMFTSRVEMLKKCVIFVCTDFVLCVNSTLYGTRTYSMEDWISLQHEILFLSRCIYIAYSEHYGAIVCCVLPLVHIFLFRVRTLWLSEAAAEGTKRMSMKCCTKKTLRYSLALSQLSWGDLQHTLVVVCWHASDWASIVAVYHMQWLISMSNKFSNCGWTLEMCIRYMALLISNIHLHPSYMGNNRPCMVMYIDTRLCVSMVIYKGDGCCKLML